MTRLAFEVNGKVPAAGGLCEALHTGGVGGGGVAEPQPPRPRGLCQPKVNTRPQGQCSEGNAASRCLTVTEQAALPPCG